MPWYKYTPFCSAWCYSGYIISFNEIDVFTDILLPHDDVIKWKHFRVAGPL